MFLRDNVRNCLYVYLVYIIYTSTTVITKKDQITSARGPDIKKKKRTSPLTTKPSMAKSPHLVSNNIGKYITSPPPPVGGL